MCGTRAYAEAYGVEESRSAATCASRLLKKAEIQAELNRLTAEAKALSRSRDKEAIGSKAARMEMLWRMAQDSEAVGNVNEAVRCVAELNKMDGAYEPEQVQVQAVELSFDSLMEGLAGSKT